jgi:two-component system sensor kinase FixL
VPERKRLDSNDIEFQAKLSSILATGPDAIIIIDEMGTIETFNAAAEQMFGYRMEEIIGKNVTILAPPAYRDEHRKRLAYHRETGAKRNVAAGRDVAGRRRDGTIFPAELFAGDMWIGTHRFITCFVRDKTGWERIEQRVRDLQSDLQHVSRLGAMAQMSSAIAHELNQPLAAIMNYVSAAATAMSTLGGTQAEQSKEFMEKAINQTARAGGIIRSLRAFVEKRESSRRHEDINEVVNEAVALGRLGFVDRNVKVNFELDTAMAPILIDRVQIEQVLINLIRNSIEAMQSVTTRELTIRTSRTTDGFVEVCVSDTGPGFSEEEAARLFQPFVTTKEGGMGIGLTICQSIIEAHDGRIWAVAKKRGGAEFRFRVPATPME